MNSFLITLLAFSFISCRTFGTFPSNALYLGPTTYKDSDDNHKFESFLNDKPEELSPAQKDYVQQVSETSIAKKVSHDNDDLSLLMGSYFNRQGILKGLGNLGPAFGLEVAVLSPTVNHWSDGEKKLNHGGFLLWTFDHFLNTDGKKLIPELRGEDYTNYMLGGGYALRYRPTEKLQIHYRGGLAVNFIEIDSFRTRDDTDNRKYTDTTISTIHKLGLDYLVRSLEDPVRANIPQIRVGPSVFYYFAPDPLGKFKLRDESIGKSPGGSLAWFLEVKFEVY